MKMIPFVLIGLFLVVVAEKPNYPVYIIDGNGQAITSQLKSILDDQLDSLPISLKTYTLGELYQMNIASDHIVRDKRVNMTLDVPSFNGDLGADFPRLLMVVKNDFSIDTDHILVNTSSPQSIIPSNPNARVNYEGKIQPIKANCSSDVTDINYNITVLPSPELKQLTKVERIGNFTFGMKANKVFLLTYFNYSISLTDVKTFESGTTHLNEISIANVWTVVHINKSLKVLFLDANNQKVFIYQLQYDQNTLSSLVLFKVIPLPSIVDIRQITLFDGYMYYSQDNKGIYQVSLSTATPNLIIDQSKFAGPFLDFVVKEGCFPPSPVLFAVIKNRGLLLYDIASTNSQKFLHPHLKQIDYFVNALQGTVFLGVLVEQTASNEEFFIEFLFTYPTSKVKVNKIFTGTMKRLIPFYTPDLFYSYLFDTIEKKMIVIRRGLINRINFVSYAIDLSSNDLPSFISSIYNKVDHKELLFLGSSSANASLFEVLSYPQYVLDCSFLEEGEYKLKLIQYTEGCQSALGNLSLSSPLNGCQKITLYNITILGDQKSELRLDTESYMIVTSLFAGIILLMSISLSTNCFKVNVFKLVNDKHHDRKEFCYEDRYIPRVDSSSIQDEFNRDPFFTVNKSDMITPKREHSSSDSKSSSRTLNRTSSNRSRESVDTSNVIVIRKK